MASHCPRWWRLTSRRSRHPNRQRRCRRFSASSAEFSRRGIPRTTRSTWPKSTYESPRRCERRAGRSTRPPASLRGERHGMVRHRKRRSGRPAFGPRGYNYSLPGLQKRRRRQGQANAHRDPASFRSGDLIVTRDPRGFRGSSVQALAPEAAAPLLAQFNRRNVSNFVIRSVRGTLKTTETEDHKRRLARKYL